MVPLLSTPPQRIAIVRPSALGDVCRTVPALVSLHNAYPQATIHWIVQDSFVEAVIAHPDLTDVIPFPRARFSRVGRSSAATREWFAWTRALKSYEFDLVFDLQGLARSGVITWFTRARRRIGFSNAREGAFFAYTARHRLPNEEHTVDRMLGLIRAEGIEPVTDMRLYVPHNSQTTWTKRRETLGISEQGYAVIAPTSRWEGKRWPAERFAQVARFLSSRGIEQILVVGSANERSQCEALFNSDQGGPCIHNMLGQTSVGELMAAIAQSRITIANDSAALHIAVGLNSPYVALYGPTNVDLVGPYGGKQWVVQPTNLDQTVTHKDTKRASAIMNQITTNEVIAKVEERLATSKECPSNIFRSNSSPE